MCLSERHLARLERRGWLRQRDQLELSDQPYVGTQRDDQPVSEKMINACMIYPHAICLPYDAMVST